MGFGLGPDDTVPEDPVAWADAQVETVPPLVWEGDIPTAEHLLDERAKFVYTDRRVIRKKFKGDRKAYREAKTRLRWETGQKYYESLDIAPFRLPPSNPNNGIIERLQSSKCSMEISRF